MGMTSITQDGDGESRDGASLARRINMSKSQNLKGNYNQYPDPQANAELYNIERKIHRANERKQHLVEGTLDKQAILLSKVE